MRIIGTKSRLYINSELLNSEPPPPPLNYVRRSKKTKPKTIKSEPILTPIGLIRDGGNNIISPIVILKYCVYCVVCMLSV